MADDISLPPGVEIAQFRYYNHTLLKGGLLPNVPGAHACWHYVRGAMIHLRSVDEGATYVGDKDHEWGLDRILRATQLMYQLANRDEIFKHMQNVRAEAARCGLPWDRRVESPVSPEHKTSLLLQPTEKFIDWIDSQRSKGPDNDE